MAGYSQSVSTAKLGFKDGMAVAFIALPSELADEAASADFALVERFADWSGFTGKHAVYDAAHAFTRERAEIEDHLETSRRDQARRHDLGLLAEEGLESADRRD